MPTITFNLKELDKYLGKKISSKALQEKVPALGTPIEEMDATSMMIEVPPNRPDLLSLPGFARALSSFIGAKPGLRKYSAKKSTYKVVIDASVKKVRPFTVCAVVKNLKFNDEKIKEIIDLQEKIHITYGRNRKKMAMGVYPMEKIQWPITYKALPPADISFIPLDFDKKMSAKQILALHPTASKYAYLLEGLKKYPLFIDNAKNVLSMPPLINSHAVGKIGTKTKEVFIECSGHDFEYLSKALNMIVTALADMGGVVYQVTLKDTKQTTTPKLEPDTLALKSDYVERIIGIKLSTAQIKTILGKMGFGWNGKALIPCYRADILHPIDLVEDIAIGYGYENLEEEIPKVASIGGLDPCYQFQNQLRDVCIGAGILEVKNFSLSNIIVQNKKMMVDTKLVELESSFSEDYSVLRHQLLPGLLETLGRNKHREYPQNLFEVGPIFKALQEVVENERLGIVLCHNTANVTSARQILHVLMQELQLKYNVEPDNEGDCPSLLDGRIGKIVVNKKNVGFMGEVSPSVLRNFELDVPVAVLELDLDVLFSLSKN